MSSKKHVVDQNLRENFKKCVSLSNNAISNPLERKNLDIACFRKVLKTTHFDGFFCFTEFDILKRFFLSSICTFVPYLSQWKNCFFN